MPGEPSDFIELTEASTSSELFDKVTPLGKFSIRLSSIDAVEPVHWNCGVVYLVRARPFSRHVIENPLELARDLNG